MRPSRVASELREIADKIDRSSRPDRLAVAGAISSLLQRVAADTPSALKKPQYLVYNDTSSPEYPLVAFFATWEGDLQIVSFQSEAELQEWEGGESPDPPNAEPIDPADADELAAAPGMKLLRKSNF